MKMSNIEREREKRRREREIENHSQYPCQTPMQFWINAFNIRQCYRLIEQLFIERCRKSAIQTVSMEYSNAQNPSNKVKIRQMIRIYICFEEKERIIKRFPRDREKNSLESGFIWSV